MPIVNKTEFIIATNPFCFKRTFVCKQKGCKFDPYFWSPRVKIPRRGALPWTPLGPPL